MRRGQNCIAETPIDISIRRDGIFIQKETYIYKWQLHAVSTDGWMLNKTFRPSFPGNSDAGTLPERAQDKAATRVALFHRI
jgi:hypothetical protein